MFDEDDPHRLIETIQPDVLVKVIRDLFNEDFRDLVVQGERAYEMVEPYLAHVSPDLVQRMRRDGADSITGGANSDTLKGGAGDDVMIGKAGA